MTDVSGTKGAKNEKFLKKEDRKKCWDARDAYWSCLKTNDENQDKCADFRKTYTQLCPPTWVNHFDRKFDYNKFKEEAAKAGYAKLDEEYSKK